VTIYAHTLSGRPSSRLPYLYGMENDKNQPQHSRTGVCQLPHVEEGNSVFRGNGTASKWAAIIGASSLNAKWTAHSLRTDRTGTSANSRYRCTWNLHSGNWATKSPSIGMSQGMQVYREDVHRHLKPDAVTASTRHVLA